MSIRKTKIEESVVERFLKKHFDPAASDVMQLSGGEMSCPFAFKVKEKEFVIRIDALDNYSFNKDAYAWKHFAKQVPVPEMFAVGKFDTNHYYAITGNAKGVMLEKLSVEDTKAIVPSIITTLENIHAIDISHTKGYCYWNADGKASYKSWKENLIIETEIMYEKLKRTNVPFIEKDLFERLYEKINKLIEYCPEERFLIHADYGFSNVLVDEKGVTAVLDWGESRYGDFVYDIAWLIMWEGRFDYFSIFNEYYLKQKKQIPNFSERIFCYKLMIIHGSFKFWIESKQFDHVKWLQEVVRPLL